METRVPMLLLTISGLAHADEVSGSSARALLGVRLETSQGAPARLEAFAEKPLVLFYEDRRSASDNQPLKDALFALGQRRGLLDAASVVGVANLAAWNWPPARQFAQAGVTAAERKAGVPLLIDWSGELTRAPCGLSASQSTVLLVHRGQVLFRQSGALSADDRERFLAALAEAIASSR